MYMGEVENESLGYVEWPYTLAFLVHLLPQHNYW